MKKRKETEEYRAKQKQDRIDKEAKLESDKIMRQEVKERTVRTTVIVMEPVLVKVTTMAVLMETEAKTVMVTVRVMAPNLPHRMAHTALVTGCATIQKLRCPKKALFRKKPIKV